MPGGVSKCESSGVHKVRSCKVMDGAVRGADAHVSNEREQPCDHRDGRPDDAVWKLQRWLDFRRHAS